MITELKNRVFKLWAYTVSHNTLILRSPMKYPDQEGFDGNSYNIDVEFSAVFYLDIPATLNGMEIREIFKAIPDKFQHYRINWDCRIFEISSNGDKYYVVAGSYIVGRSKWVTEDRISNMNLKYDSIISSSNG